MKLKIKHIQQPQQAHRVEVPNGASLEELRSAVLTSLAFSKTTAASQVSLSLNKKDAIHGEDSSSLASLGICSGDLLWVLAPPVAADPAPPPPLVPAAAASVPAAAAAVPQQCVKSTPAAMGIDTSPQLVQQQQQQEQQQQEQQQQHPASPADADHATADNEHLQALRAELASSPAQVWMPDSLAALLSAAGSESRQQQQQQLTLSPAQVLMLTAHAALLECGFAHIPPSTAASVAGAGSSSGSTGAASATTDAAQAVLSALRGSPGVFSLCYSLPAASGVSAGVLVQLCGLDMGQHLVLVGNLQTPPPPAVAAAPAPAAGDASSSSSHSRSNSSRMVATLNLSKGQVGPPACTDAAGASSAAPSASTTAAAGAQPSQQHRQHQQQQQATLAGYPVCSFQELPKLWVQLKDGLGLPLLMASCAAAGLPPPLGLNSLTYELQEAILGLLEAKELAALCCSCSPMRHRASTDTLWQPLFEREFPAPAEDQQQQQHDKGAAKPQPQPAAAAAAAQQQQQQQGGAPTPAAGPGVSAADSSSAAGAAGSSSSSAAQAPTLPQQPQQQPLHARLQYVLSHGQRYTLRQSLRQLRQEAGRRGWKWAFGAAWMQRGRLLAEAERNRRLGPMPLHVLPHPNPMPWGPFRPRQPMMPPNIIGGDYDRFPNVGGFGFGAGNLPGGLGFSGSGVGPGFMPGGGMGLGSGGGAMFSGGGGGALGQAGPVPAGFRGPRGGGGLGPGGMPGLGGGRRSGNSSSNTRLY